jgi:hypothetical protein
MFGIRDWSDPAKYVIRLQEEKRKWKRRAKVLIATNVLTGVALVVTLVLRAV